MQLVLCCRLSLSCPAFLVTGPVTCDKHTAMAGLRSITCSSSTGYCVCLSDMRSLVLSGWFHRSSTDQAVLDWLGVVRCRWRVCAQSLVPSSIPATRHAHTQITDACSRYKRQTFVSACGVATPRTCCLERRRLWHGDSVS